MWATTSETLHPWRRFAKSLPQALRFIALALPFDGVVLPCHSDGMLFSSGLPQCLSSLLHHGVGFHHFLLLHFHGLDLLGGEALFHQAICIKLAPEDLVLLRVVVLSHVGHVLALLHVAALDVRIRPVFPQHCLHGSDTEITL